MAHYKGGSVVFKKGSWRWVGCITVGGKQKRTQQTFNSEAEALAYKEFMYNKYLEEQMILKTDSPTMGILFEQWKKNVWFSNDSSKKFSETTIRDWNTLFRRHILPFIENQNVLSLDLTEFNEYLENLSLSNSTIKNIKYAFKAFLKYCVKIRKLDLDVEEVMGTLTAVGYGKTEKIYNVLLERDYSRIIDYMIEHDMYYQNHIRFLRVTGLRFSELAITIQDLVFNELEGCNPTKKEKIEYMSQKNVLKSGYMKIRKTIKRVMLPDGKSKLEVLSTMKTPNANREVPLSNLAIDLIADQIKSNIKNNRNTQYIFCSSTGGLVEYRNVLRSFHNAIIGINRGIIIPNVLEDFTEFLNLNYTFTEKTIEQIIDKFERTAKIVIKFEFTEKEAKEMQEHRNLKGYLKQIKEEKLITDFYVYYKNYYDITKAKPKEYDGVIARKGVHALRKLFCKDGHEVAGLDWETLRQIAGHSSSLVTQKYYYYLVGNDVENIAKLMNQKDNRNTEQLRNNQEAIYRKTGLRRKPSEIEQMETFEILTYNENYNIPIVQNALFDIFGNEISEDTMHAIIYSYLKAKKETEKINLSDIEPKKYPILFPPPFYMNGDTVDDIYGKDVYNTNYPRDRMDYSSKYDVYYSHIPFVANNQCDIYFNEYDVYEMDMVVKKFVESIELNKGKSIFEIDEEKYPILFLPKEETLTKEEIFKKMKIR